MAKLRNPVIPEAVAKALLYKCMVCSKPVEGFYSRHGDQGTCSGACMKVQDAKPRYPEHSEEEFLKRFNL
jgi:DNA-directed RNA polymerase subunit RPC12/RpoP